mgnify:FL=1
MRDKKIQIKKAIALFSSCFVLSGCLFIPSRYKEFETYVDSKWVHYSEAAWETKKVDVKKIYIEATIRHLVGDDLDLVTALNQYVVNEGFSIAAENEAELMVKISSWEDKSGPALPGFLIFLNPWDQVTVYTFLVEFSRNSRELFLECDLYVDKLRNALGDERLANRILLEKIGLDANTVVTASEKTLLRALNGILGMRDFHSKIAADQYESLISGENRQLLIRAQVYDPSLADKDYLKLNRALLEAIYPREIKRSVQNEESFVKNYKVVQSWYYDRSPDMVNFWSTLIYNVGEDIVKFAANNFGLSGGGENS